MTTPTGTISLLDVALELCNPGGRTSLNDTETRALAGVPSGAISLSNCKGKTNITASGGSQSGTPTSALVNGTVSAISPVTSYSWSVVSTSGTGSVSIYSGQTSKTCTFSITDDPGGFGTTGTVRCSVVSRGITRVVETSVTYRCTSIS